MADSEFEELRHSFHQLPSHLPDSTSFYSLVYNVLIDEESASSRSYLEVDCDTKKDVSMPISSTENLAETIFPVLSCAGERRRRKLPEIPKNKKPSNGTMNNPQSFTKEMCLADELGHSNSGSSSMIILRSGYLWDTDSPDSERVTTDADSGHSTAHSPSGTDGFKSMSPVIEIVSNSLGGSSLYNNVEMLEATHRGLHKFVPRHNDEIDIEIGDPVYVQKEADDLWCEGVNLRTGRMGIFPSAYAVDCDYSDWDTSCEHGRRERYLLGYLGSVETLAHKGTSVVCQAVKKVIESLGYNSEAQFCTLEISDQGLRMVNKKKQNQAEPCIDYFYSLKNVSFCAFHPRDHRYLGFITKHPTLQRFACHVFRGTDSTRPVAEAVGRAFQRFYQKFIETAYPVEDIYIE